MPKVNGRTAASIIIGGALLTFSWEKVGWSIFINGFSSAHSHEVYLTFDMSGPSSDSLADSVATPIRVASAALCTRGIPDGVDIYGMPVAVSHSTIFLTCFRSDSSFSSSRL